VVTNQANPYALAALATAAVPGLNVIGVTLSQLTAGYAFALAEDSAGRLWVIRLPRNQAAATASDSEVKLLDSLRSAIDGVDLPFEVVTPRGFAPDTDGMRAMVYREPPGDPLVLELLEPGPGLAASIGRALGALHEVPPTLATEAGLPGLTPQAYRARLRQEVDRADQSGHVSARLVERWRDQLDHDPYWVFTPVVIHGDMAAEHILVQGGRVATLLNLTGVQVSDPAEDLAPLMAALPPEVGQSIIEAYRDRRTHLDDEHLDDRVELLAELAVIRWLLYGLDSRDQGIIDDARVMLADLDQAVADEQAEAARLAAHAEETHQRLEAAKRASAAAAREHQRTSGSMPKIEASLIGEPAAGTLAYSGQSTSADDAAFPPVQDPASPPWASAAGIGQSPSGIDGPPEWNAVNPSPTNGAQTEVFGQTAPTRKPVTADGVAMWGTTKQEAPVWDDDPFVAAASKPPPGLPTDYQAAPFEDQSAYPADQVSQTTPDSTAGQVITEPPTWLEPASQDSHSYPATTDASASQAIAEPPTWLEPAGEDNPSGTSDRNPAYQTVPSQDEPANPPGQDGPMALDSPADQITAEPPTGQETVDQDGPGDQPVLDTDQLDRPSPNWQPVQVNSTNQAAQNQPEPLQPADSAAAGRQTKLANTKDQAVEAQPGTTDQAQPAQPTAHNSAPPPDHDQGDSGSPNPKDNPGEDTPTQNLLPDFLQDATEAPFELPKNNN